jgi:hypothetical protein
MNTQFSENLKEWNHLGDTEEDGKIIYLKGLGRS